MSALLPSPHRPALPSSIVSIHKSWLRQNKKKKKGKLGKEKGGGGGEKKKKKKAYIVVRNLWTNVNEIIAALAEVAVDLKTTPTVTNLSLAFYMLAMAFTPLWW